MNLSKLFEMQSVLDKRIVEEKGLQGQDLLDKKILALQVELGELANEWRGFKFWSEDREPRTRKIEGCPEDEANMFFCPGCGREYSEKQQKEFDVCPADNRVLTPLKKTNPLLEEYVDCLHFILSIGLELGQEEWKPHYSKVAVHFGGDELTTQFNELFRFIASIRTCLKDEKFIFYGSVFSNFLGLGEMLGFTWNQIEQAYFDKNEVNHARQQNGY